MNNLGGEVAGGNQLVESQHKRVSNALRRYYERQWYNHLPPAKDANNLC